MARRRNKAGRGFLGVAIATIVIALIVGKVLDRVGVTTAIVIFVLVIAGPIWYKHAQRQKRIQYLLDKYGDEQIVNRILHRQFWQGQTAQ